LNRRKEVLVASADWAHGVKFAAAYGCDVTAFTSSARKFDEVNGSLERKRCAYPCFHHPACRASRKSSTTTSSGVTTAKIATIAAGERPTDLTRDEAVAYDVAAALNRSGPLPETIYEAGIDAFRKQGMAEIIYLVGCFHLVGVILNGYDVSVPGREDGKQP
jgi:hypothetical protein